MRTPMSGVRLSPALRGLVEHAAGAGGDQSDGIRALLLLGAAQAGLLGAAHERDLAHLLGEPLDATVRAALRELYNRCFLAAQHVFNTPATGVEPSSPPLAATSPWDVGFEV
jgi:hypothetical protein